MDHVSVTGVGGRGTPVILISGLSATPDTWRDIVPGLARRHRVYLVQVNGFGGTAPRANLGSGILSGITADLHRFIREHRLHDAAIVGHSMGGVVGLMLAARHPESVGRLMVVDALPWFGIQMLQPGTQATVADVEPRAAQIRAAVAATYGHAPDPAAAEANVATMTLRPERRPELRAWAMSSDPRVAAQAMYEDLTTDLRPELRRIRAPVTVVYAWNRTYPRKDPATAFFRREYSAVPHVTVEEVGESAHFVMFDQPAAFQEALTRFLRLPRGGGRIRPAAPYSGTSPHDPGKDTPAPPAPR